jgi:hypothetical protein
MKNRPFRIELTQTALVDFFKSPNPKKFVLDRITNKIKESRQSLNEANRIINKVA